jgi:hypothetical protein
LQFYRVGFAFAVFLVLLIGNISYIILQESRAGSGKKAKKCLSTEKGFIRFDVLNTTAIERLKVRLQ